MKATLVSSSLIALASASALPQGHDHHAMSLPASAAPAAVVPPAPKAAWDAAPQGQRVIPSLPDTPIIDGATRKEVLYGPYTVPAGGMVTKNEINAQSPCKDCYVTAMFATIKYPNGKEALTSEGAWLHHTVLAGSPGGTIWAAGNERPTIRLNSQHKYGIDWPNGNLFFTLDLMSEKKEAFNVSMSITYEYILKNSAMGKQYKPIYMRWNQIGYPMPPKGKAVFKSRPWTATVSGKMLYSIGHMHDGGTNLKLLINDKVVCDSVMFYGGREGYGAAKNASSIAPPPAVASPKAAAPAPVVPAPKAAAPPPPAPVKPSPSPKAAAPPAPVPAKPAPSPKAAAPPVAAPKPALPSPKAPAKPSPKAQRPPPKKEEEDDEEDDEEEDSRRWFARSAGHSASSSMQRRSPQHSHGGSSSASFGGVHLSNPGACTNFGEVKKGDVMHIEAYYDMTQYAAMTHQGEEERLMGNMRVYIGVD